MEFVLSWFWYLLAFALGMFVANLAATRLVPARTPEEAVQHALEESSIERADHAAPALDDADEEGDAR